MRDEKTAVRSYAILSLIRRSSVFYRGLKRDQTQDRDLKFGPLRYSVQYEYTSRILISTYCTITVLVLVHVRPWRFVNYRIYFIRV